MTYSLAVALQAPERQELPLAILKVGSDGLLMEVSEDGLGLATCACLRTHAPFAQSLSAHHRAFWDLTQWPALVAAGSLNEAALEFTSSQGRSWAALSYWRQSDEGGRSVYTGLLVPGTERRDLIRQLRRSQDSLLAMPAAVLQLKATRGDVLELPYAAGALLELMGVSCAMVTDAPDMFLGGLDRESCERLLRRIHEDPADMLTFTEVLALRRGGASRLELNASRSDGQGVWHCVLTDVSEREQLRTELELLATTDELTGLANRRSLMSALLRGLQRAQPIALFFMDCDRFKQINDSLGHSAGDELLRKVADRLRSEARTAEALGDVDVVAARLGGDEFVLMVAGIDSEAAACMLAQRLVDAIARPYRLENADFVISVSIGLALADPASTPEQLLRDADTAMYEAKRVGRGRWVLFEPAMQLRVASALALEGDLRRALAAGEIRAAFQPIVDVTTGQIRGLEALARWCHPVRGEISPTEFIPVAEESGLISALGSLMLEKACAALATWRKVGLAEQVRMSVNLSRSQLLEEQLPSRIEALLDRFSLPADALQLEVTETMAMEMQDLSAALSVLRSISVRLSLDDFGTGHSSLAALHRLPVQEVKIDRSFVKEIGGSAYHQAVIQAALHVAGALKLDVVAEGVETAEQAILLNALGCPSAQGWLYSKAVEQEDVAPLLQRPSLLPSG